MEKDEKIILTIISVAVILGIIGDICLIVAAIKILECF